MSTTAKGASENKSENGRADANASAIPTVSVCVPTYNYGRFLTDTIESILQQDLTDFELIVSDDASTDNTVELVSRYAAQDPRVRLVRNERRLGMNGNIKRVADLARGRYIKMLCADDWLAPRCLSRLVELMDAHPSALIGASAVIHTLEDGTPTDVSFLFGSDVSLIPGDAMLERMAQGQGFGGHSSFILRQGAYKKIGGYNDAWLYAADYDIAARLCQIGDFLHTDEPLFYGRVQPEASSQVNPRQLQDVPDWFQIPATIFNPRPPFSQSWRRYHQLSGMLTARYLTQIGLEYARGHNDYASALGKLLLREGNFLAGLPMLPFHMVTRAARRITGTNRPAARPPEPWMGPPRHRGTV
jgi:glycosyltransferase involved in cell wall biosynthesis